MSYERKRNKVLRVVFSRTAVVFLMLAVQVLILIASLYWLKDYFVFVYGAMTLLSVILVICIINERQNPMFKLAWMIPILIIPVFGALLYLFVQLQIGTKIIAYRLKIFEEKLRPIIKQDEKVLKSLDNEDKQVGNLARYMNTIGTFPVYENTNITYFKTGEDKFAEMKKQLESAKKFIFMEYFIVDEGIMWDSILEILAKKAKEGVEVRVMYDGMCSIVLLPYRYPRTLEAMGIRCKMFSPIRPALSTHQNNRDHRKILVVDGHTAFTGGINLADEYINEKKVYGHWKDTAIMLKGDGVQSFTAMFLQMWNVDVAKEEDFKKYIFTPPVDKKLDMSNSGYVIPYGDSPFDKENVGEQVYMDIINTATRYVHIMTPYLILDNEMIVSLKYAAKRGVDVVIIMPHIPDKWYAYILARTYYQELIESGVKIYEYTPGFVHAKVFTSDDKKAVVGTINLDYRSLYLHFECAAYLYNNSEIEIIEKDYQDTLNNCQLITLENCYKLNVFKKMLGRVFRLFAPLM